MKNKSYLKMYLQPVLSFFLLSPNAENISNLNENMQQFYRSNEVDTEHVFKQKAKAQFNDEVEAAYKMFIVKRLNTIYNYLTFFVVITILSMIAAVIGVISS